MGNQEAQASKRQRTVPQLLTLAGTDLNMGSSLRQAVPARAAVAMRSQGGSGSSEESDWSQSTWGTESVRLREKP